MSETPLFRRLILGEEDAAARVTATARGIVAGRGYYIPADERGDVVQNTVLDVWRAVMRPDFSFSGDFDAFVRTVAHRRCVDWIRRRRLTEPLEPDLQRDPHSPDEALAAREKIALGRRVLAALGESCRELLQLRVVRKLGYREIAAQQQRTEGALRNQMYKCLSRAREIFAQLQSEG